jgi:hypothetical protein
MESPEGQELLDELARCFVQAAVERRLKEQQLRMPRNPNRTPPTV